METQLDQAYFPLHETALSENMRRLRQLLMTQKIYSNGRNADEEIYHFILLQGVAISE